MKTVAIIGCGQLAMMMAQAAKKIGLHVSFVAYDNEDVRSVSNLGKIVRYSRGKSVAKLFKDLGEPEVVTVEREQVDVALLHELSDFCQVHPNPDAVKVTQNRIYEKELLQHFGFAVAPYKKVRNVDDLLCAFTSLYPPLFVKHPTSGYDGKNQWRLNSIGDLEKITIPEKSFPLVAEEKVPFLYEASLIAARSKAGEIRYYPPTVNEHKEGILLKSYTTDNKKINRQILPARKIMATLLEHWDYVGVLSLELFCTEDGLIVNELAPRVHNSGHWTMDGCSCSQFENHIRAITGKKLGDTKAQFPAGMVNLLGVDSAPKQFASNSKIYWYNKTPKPKRKMGHINIVDEDNVQLEEKQNFLIQEIYSNSELPKKSA